MEFIQKVFNKDDDSPERKEYEKQKMLFMSENSPFHIISILLMNEKQRDQLFEWILLPPKDRPPLNIEGCGSSQEDFEKWSQEILNNIFPQHVPEGVTNGKHNNRVARKQTAKKK